MDHAFRDDAGQAVEEVSDFVEEAAKEATLAGPSQVSPALAMARASAARAEADPTPKGRAWGHEVLMLVRRSHLYAGLLLYPWVLLYGVTAFLFNHPSAFSDRTTIAIDRGAMKGTSLEKLPTPLDLASKVVAALNERAGGGSTYALVNPDAARFERGGLAASVRAGDGKSYTVTLDRDGGLVRLAPAGAGAGAANGGMNGEAAPTGERAGMRRARGEGEAAGPRPEGGERGEGGPRRGRGEGGEAEGAERRGRGGPRDEAGSEGAEAGGRRGPEGPRAPFAAASGVTIEGPSFETIRKELPAVLARAGLADATVSEVRAAPLTFQMEGEGRPWLVSYNLQTGGVSGRPVDDPASQAELTTRRFLLRLHTIHGYPAEFGQRWIWALIVDVMAFLMVFWGLSGIVMWWQIKRLRRIGAVALTFSTVAAVWIGVGMHYYFVNGGR
ncbi:PepSY domain-containing protein [Paludisphaera soli]|uniref:PepSY domain-containing protein n=1 Tax=Paludisphaera soli TaxID=2712865 RepID=UPI0013EDADB0|nr:PepSY domain-containing protein [Paludisphaera soli]